MQTRRLIALALLAALVLASSACDTGPGRAPSTPAPTAIASPTPATLLPTATTAIEPSATSVPAPSDTPAPPAASPTTAPAPATATTQPVPTAPAARPPATHTALAARPTAAEPASPTSAPRPAPTSAASTPSIVTIASGFGNPDDLTVGPGGEIYFGDFGNNALNVLVPGGAPRVVASGLRDPEGMVVAGDGAIILAEQLTNRILEINPHTGAKKVLRQLVNNTGQDGADGVALDPATGDILIPDSPYGRILRMSRDGSSLQTIATGFVRPTGVAVESSGTMVVADEFGNAVYRLNRDGSRARLARIFQPDDILVGGDGSIYVNSLGGEIARIDPVTGALHALATGLKLPHGLGLDAAGNVIVAESGRNRILKIVLKPTG